jgi:amidase
MRFEETNKKLEICKQWAATDGVEKAQTASAYGVDVIVAPADSFFAGVAVGASQSHTKYQRSNTVG